VGGIKPGVRLVLNLPRSALRMEGIMDSIRIAAATEAEKKWAAGIMAGSEPWTALGRNFESCLEVCLRPEYEVFVARQGDQPCGFVILVRHGVAGSPYIASIAVADGFRGSGIGSRMLEYAENLFRPTARHVFLCVSSFNLRARALYERHGYRAVGEFKDYVVDGASEILMHKRLRQS
jgi:ribosomal protein S18 acetylase RimI-like enzyme